MTLRHARNLPLLDGNGTMCHGHEAFLTTEDLTLEKRQLRWIYPREALCVLSSLGTMPTSVNSAGSAQVAWFGRGAETDGNVGVAPADGFVFIRTSGPERGSRCSGGHRVFSINHHGGQQDK